MTTITIDTRETMLCNHFRSVDNAEIRALDVGDILLTSDTDSIVIERKTLPDFAASIRDGRHREQKARLVENYPSHRIIFLIEGMLSPAATKTIGSVPESTLVSSMMNTMLRDGLHVYKTQSILETIHTITDMARKLEKGDFTTKISELSKDGSYCSLLKKQKKQNLTPRVCYIQQLSLVPGISVAMADAIAAKYPTIVTLLSEMNRNSTEFMVRAISDLTFGAKMRRVGPKASKKLVSYLLQNE